MSAKSNKDLMSNNRLMPYQTADDDLQMQCQSGVGRNCLQQIDDSN